MKQKPNKGFSTNQTLPNYIFGEGLRNYYQQIILSILCLILYGNTLHNGFVLDDSLVFKENVLVKQGISAIPRILTTPHLYGYLNVSNDMYRPLSLVLFALENSIFGTNPTAAHLINIILFIGCVLMLHRLLLKWFGSQNAYIPILSALFFALHPVHTEVVANIKSGDELLCYFFAIYSLILYNDYYSQKSNKSLIFGTITFFLSLLSKETSATFILLIPVIFLFLKKDHLKRGLTITATVSSAFLFYLILRWLVLKSAPVAISNESIDFSVNALKYAPDNITRIATEIFALGKYMILLFIPYPLLCNYSFKSIPFVGFNNIWVWVTTIVYAFIVIKIVMCTLKKKHPILVFSLLFYIITISIFSNFLFYPGAQFAERFLFFPSTGFCVFLAYVFYLLILQSEKEFHKIYANKKSIIIIIPIVFIFGYITINRNMDWKSNYTLFKSDVSHSPNDCRLNFYFAKAILNNDKNDDGAANTNKEEMDQSIEYLQKSLNIYPDFAEAHTELGRIYDQLQIFDSAEYHDKYALKIQPLNAIATYNLGRTYYEEKKLEPAIELFKKTIIIQPDNEMCLLNLARCFADDGKFDSSILYYLQLLKLDENLLLAQQGIAVAYMQINKPELAERHFIKAIQLKPNDIDEIYNLGVVYFKMELWQKAIEAFSKVVSLNRNYLNAYQNLGQAYMNVAEYQNAISCFQYALRVTPNNPTFYNNLALCYEKLGEKDSLNNYRSVMKSFNK